MEEIEVPTEHLHETLEEKARESESNWVMKVALTAALLAVFAAITALMAGHHSNEAMIEQIRSSDQWAFYQAKGIKAAVLESRNEMLLAMGKEVKPEAAEKLKSYREDQKEIDKKAREYSETSEHHLSLHNTLAKGVTIFQIAIAICAISALTKRKWLWYGSMILGLAGLVFLWLGLL
ncbi:MAG: DUF4337 domain-containing protein [Bacteroidetes bacterium]|nr:DUF4337 domain-containing protein [Bacteroidota bacterium]